eukprot:scaffold213922_cov28-Tisochrysis_lutea.AAC.3
MARWPASAAAFSPGELGSARDMDSVEEGVLKPLDDCVSPGLGHAAPTLVDVARELPHPRSPAPTALRPNILRTRFDPSASSPSSASGPPRPRPAPTTKAFIPPLVASNSSPQLLSPRRSAMGGRRVLTTVPNILHLRSNEALRRISSRSCSWSNVLRMPTRRENESPRKIWLELSTRHGPSSS